MFEARAVNVERVESVLVVLRRYGRGETVPHAAIGGATGLDPSDDRASEYYRICRRARDRYRDEDGVTSIPINGVGFRLLTAQETLVDYQRSQMKRARRQVRKAGKSAACLPAADLSLHHRQLREAAIRRAKEQEKFLAERAARADETARPYQSLPFRRPEPRRPDSTATASPIA